ncbi:hypothetical protein GUJ93_ZPchr0006g45184 [Zizania palustris]|uniref:C2 domain-containing protein n=1 Tax=Zizania palustris TaxID=103762 RepID=A0A8J5SD50_ZIZPA|nr:hypothetical protein GUJ93_ZPchr0006g45184 [Zizania palustris]
MTDGGPPLIARRLAVEVVDAFDLMPKDGLGTSNAYAVVDFDEQRKCTRTVPRDINPQWHERLMFVVPNPAAMHAYECLLFIRSGSLHPLR